MTETAVRRRRQFVLEDVLREVRRGRVVRLDLDHLPPEDRRTRDFTGAVRLLAHLLGARVVAAGGASEGESALARFPVTTEALYRTSIRLGKKVPRDTCRRYRRLLIDRGVIVYRGQYKQRFNRYSPNAPYIVRLYATKMLVHCRPGKLNFPSAGRTKSSAARSRKRARWWEHTLFGDYEGLPPPGWTRRDRRHMNRLDGLDYETWVAAAANAR